jgi:hypothetical protein
MRYVIISLMILTSMSIISPALAVDWDCGALPVNGKDPTTGTDAEFPSDACSSSHLKAVQQAIKACEEEYQSTCQIEYCRHDGCNQDSQGR